MGIRNVKDKCGALRIFFGVLLFIEALASLVSGYLVVMAYNNIPIGICVTLLAFMFSFISYCIIMVWVDTSENIQVMTEKLEHFQPVIVNNVTEPINENEEDDN